MEEKLKARIAELNQQKQQGINLLNTLNRELLMVDGMISEAVKMLESLKEQSVEKAEDKEVKDVEEKVAE